MHEGKWERISGLGLGKYKKSTRGQPPGPEPSAVSRLRGSSGHPDPSPDQQTSAGGEPKRVGEMGELAREETNEGGTKEKVRRRRSREETVSPQDSEIRQAAPE